jgi:carbon dioxide concentrating mechanism protein CcmO
MSALAFLEIPFFSVTALVADHVAKAADVRLLGFEGVGDERILVRLGGDPGALASALAAAEVFAESLGVPAIATRIARPPEGFSALVHFPNSISGLYGGRDQCLPTDFPSPLMNANQHAIGILETQGLTAILEATDAMLKAADVTLVGKEKIGAAYVTVVIRGDVAAVQAAIDAGRQAVGSLGKLIAAHVIARPHADLVALLPR